MLSPTFADQVSKLGGKDNNTNRNLRRERRLWHRSTHATGGLGCTACPDRDECGGLCLQSPFFDCLQFCCHNPANCDRVCRNHPDYVDRVREVGAFSLGTVTRAPVLPAPALPFLVPVLYHRAGRTTPPALNTVALSLYEIFDRRSGLPRHWTRASLTNTFMLRPRSTIVLTGIDRDPPLERWWGLGEEKRRRIIQAMKTAGVALVTTPNYSLFTDRPRWDDLHAMKRIAIVHAEFLLAGLPAAIHVNGRTDRDFERWTDYIAERSEITHVAYEFATGAGWKRRRPQHAAWLAALAAAVDRPLHLVVRGGMDQLQTLAGAFAGVTVLDTSIFMKTMMRQIANLKNNGAVGWMGIQTSRGAPLDKLFADNFCTVNACVGRLVAGANNRMGRTA